MNIYDYILEQFKTVYIYIYKRRITVIQFKEYIYIYDIYINTTNEKNMMAYLNHNILILLLASIYMVGNYAWNEKYYKWSRGLLQKY